MKAPSSYGQDYQKSFNSISKIPIRSRFSVIVARRIYKRIGHYILKQKNLDKYSKAGKIYVPLSSKISETFFSTFDFLKLLFVKNINYDNHKNHNIHFHNLLKHYPYHLYPSCCQNTVCIHF